MAQAAKNTALIFVTTAPNVSWIPSYVPTDGRSERLIIQPLATSFRCETEWILGAIPLLASMHE
jgi:hypothetical protein